MHLMIGFVLASLLRRKKNNALTLPNIRGEFEARHALPGRIRFRVPMLETADNFHIETIQKELSKVPHIHSVNISPFSGSILIQYNTAKIEPPLICGILIKILGLENAFETIPESAVQREIRMIGDAFNQAVYNKTAGALDLTSAIFILTLSLGLYKTIILKDRALPGGFNLLWWAYVVAKSRK